MAVRLFHVNSRCQLSGSRDTIPVFASPRRRADRSRRARRPSPRRSAARIAQQFPLSHTLHHSVRASLSSRMLRVVRRSSSRSWTTQATPSPPDSLPTVLGVPSRLMCAYRRPVAQSTHHSRASHLLFSPASSYRPFLFLPLTRSAPSCPRLVCPRPRRLAGRAQRSHAWARAEAHRACTTSHRAACTLDGRA